MTNETGAADEPQTQATAPDPVTGETPEAARGATPGSEHDPEAGTTPASPEHDPADDHGTTGTSPFAGIPVGDYVRDGVAAVLLLVSFALPWDVAHRASDKVEVVLLTILSLLTLALPYLARTGVLPATWTVHTTRRVRLLANAPYVLLAAVYLVVDVVGGGDLSDGWGGVGSAVGLGLAGALLAAQPRRSELGPEELDRAVTVQWLRVLAALGAVLVVMTLLTVILTITGVDGVGAVGVLLVLLAAVFVVALAGLPTFGTWRRSEAARLTLVGVGIVLACAFVLGSGNNGILTFESTHLGRFGLVLVPALAAVAASPAVHRAMAPAPVVETWVGVAVRGLDLVVVVAGYLALGGVLELAGGSRGGHVVLSVVVGLLAVGVALVARRSLARDAATGRPLALGAAGVVAVLGIALLVVTANQVRLGGGVEHVLLAFGLPLLVASALTVPREVREYFAEHRPVPAAAGAETTRAYVWQPPAPKPPRPARPSAPAGPVGGAQPTPTAGGATGAVPVQTVHPERSGYAARPGLIPVDAQTTAVLPAYTDEGQGAPGQAAQQGQAPAQPYAPAGAPGQGAPQGYGEQQGYGAQQGYAGQQGYTGQASPDQTAPMQAYAPQQHEPQPYAQQAPEQQAPQQPAPPQYAPQYAAQQPGFTAEQALDPSTPLEVLAQIVQDVPHLRPQVASNPSTYPALLEWLGNLGDPAVDAALRSRR